jgi:hypothetical protein
MNMRISNYFIIQVISQLTDFWATLYVCVRLCVCLCMYVYIYLPEQGDRNDKTDLHTLNSLESYSGGARFESRPGR